MSPGRIACAVVFGWTTSVANAQTIGCELGGLGGPVPAIGLGGGGLFPTQLPPGELELPLTVVSVPPGATVVSEVRLRGLVHPWASDLQIVLTAPNGSSVNLLQRVGGSCDFAGDYVVVPPCTGAASVGACASVLAPGAYSQGVGDWPAGASGIANTPLASIPAASGTWRLSLYDWASGDAGSIDGWELCFGTPPPAAPPASAPTPTSPAQASTVSSPVRLRWSAAACAASYDVELDGVVTAGVAALELQVSPAPGAHAWRVRASSSAGAGPWSPQRSFVVASDPPPATCVAAGAGGLVPASGTGGGGDWPASLPPNEFASSYAIAVPTGATRLVRVELLSFAHDFAGDLQIVLTDPAGARHNVLHRPSFNGSGYGSSCDFDGGDYVFHASEGVPFPTNCPPSGDLPNGHYNQHFGAWSHGSLGILNTPLGDIPASSGVWTLSIYDWTGGDAGSLGSWQLCFAGPVMPARFCAPVAPGTSHGCLPTISVTAEPVVSHAQPCVLHVQQVEGQKIGLFFYGVSGQVSFPWCSGASSSFLCVKSPVQRLAPQSSGGTPSQCDGTLSADWNQFQGAHPAPLGSPWTAGDRVEVQAWFRDPPSCRTTFLSEGVTLTYRP